MLLANDSTLRVADNCSFKPIIWLSKHGFRGPESGHPRSADPLFSFVRVDRKYRVLEHVTLQSLPGGTKKVGLHGPGYEARASIVSPRQNTEVFKRLVPIPFVWIVAPPSLTRVMVSTLLTWARLVEVFENLVSERGFRYFARSTSMSFVCRRCCPQEKHRFRGTWSAIFASSGMGWVLLECTTENTRDQFA